MGIKEGNKYGILTTLKLVKEHKDNRSKNIQVWECSCDCGNTCEKNSRYLLERDNPNCGCIKKKQNIEWGKSRKLLNGNAALNNLFKKYKNSAKKRNYEFELTIDQFQTITSRNCHYCGLRPEQSSYSNGSKTSDYIYNGIDRVDNTKGYVLENIVPCCKHCNFAKRNMTTNQWKDWLIRIVNFNKEYIK